MNKDKYSDFRKFITSTKINGKNISGLAVDDYHKMLDYQSPMIYQTSPDYGVAIPVHTKLLEDNIILISEFEQDSADIVCGQLLYLTNISPDKDITLHINSYGGDTTALYSMLDVCNYIPNTINTVAMGIAASCGACLLILAGDYGHRYAQMNSSILIHQPMTSCQGPAADIEITCNEINRIKHNMFQSIADRSGNKYEDIEKLAVRDAWLTPEQCLEKHFIDNIIKPQDNKKKTYLEWLADKEKEKNEENS